ncbi:Uma2 family endonuclease [soil metagenome]
MAAMSVAERMTAEEFLALPVPELGRPWNLVDGEVVVNDPTALHGDVLEILLFAVGSWTRATPGRGKVTLSRDLRIDGRNVFVPDLLWYRDGRVPDSHDPPPYPLPDIAAEVRSPSTWRHDRGAKRSGYERHGLPELWLLDTVADRVRVLRRFHPDGPRFDIEFDLGSEETLTSPLLPGFELPLAGVFPERR